MDLALLESGFWFGNALRAAGLRYGAVGAAVKMVEWAETYHRIGVRLLDARGGQPLAADPERMRVVAETETSVMLDGGGQSGFLLGPPMLDLATAKARETGHGLVTATAVEDSAWLGQLAEQAARRGLVCFLAFQTVGPEARLLETCYSTGRSVAALPGDGGPLWVELASASVAHERLLSGYTFDRAEAMVPAATTPVAEAPAGVSLACFEVAESARAVLAERLLESARAQGAAVRQPNEVAALWRRVRQEGFDVDSLAWERVARRALTTVVSSSNESRSQAGAS